MPKPKKRPDPPPVEVHQILIEELDIADDLMLTPEARVEDLQNDPEALTWIIVRLENLLEVEIPDDAETNLITIQDIYNLVAKVSK